LDSLLGNYDRRATPTNHLGVATEVECKLYVRSLGSINPDTMDYQVDLYLRQHWSDQRLNHPQLIEPLDLNDPNLVKAIWKPEVYFPNAKDAEFQYVTVPNVLVRIDPGGQILYMLRLKLKFSCMMELSNFPLDEQVCTMEIASFSKTTKELILRWKNDLPVDISSEVKMPQFEIFKVNPARCEETFHIGNYSCLLAELHLSRSLGFHMVQSYLPTILIVVISWVSFWMDVDSVAGRTTLGVTTLLTVSSKASDVQAEVPLVSYVKAIDIWMGACTGFIFAALLEFTLTNYLWRKGSKLRRDQFYVSRNQKSKSFGPVAATMTAAASGFDPTMFTTMMAAGAVAGNTADEEKIPLTSPAHSLLKRKNYRDVSSGHADSINLTELEPRPQLMRRAFSVDNYQKLESTSASPTSQHHMRTSENGRPLSYVDTEVRQDQKGSNCRVVTFQNDVNSSKASNGAHNHSDDEADLQDRSGSTTDDEGVRYCRRAILLDELSRVLFPLSFMVFNVCYWVYYTQIAK